MNNVIAIRAITVSVVSVALLAGAGVARGQAVGRTPGSFAVSPTGASTYTLPIWAPRGPNGLQPSIALTYNSQQGIGPEGVGWSLSGLSSIYRCNLTYAQDAAPGPITLTTSDGLCLDGQRLRLTSGTYGEAGSTYQTEVATFANVTAYGSAGNGPAYFTVQAANGTTYTYGNGGHSQVLASGTSTAWTWMLDEVSDRAGNTMTISYTTATGTVVPSTISWTPSSYGSSNYNYTMQFSYGANVAQSSPAGYVAGTPVQNPNLLGSIAISYQGTAVKTYYLSYQQQPTTTGTGRDVLTAVQECAGSGTGNCFPATTMQYQTGSAGVSTNAISPPIPAPQGFLYANHDFNGDGYSDLVYTYEGNLYVAFGSASGYGTPFNTGIPVGTGASQGILIGDVLGTGKDGVLADNGGTWWYYTWNGSSFVGTSTGLAFDSTAISAALADVNGDGLPDLVLLYLNGYTVTATTRLNTSSGGSVSFSPTAVTALTDTGYEFLSANFITPDTQFGRLRAFDFNGDGRQDLALSETACSGRNPYTGGCLGTGEFIKELISQTGGTFEETIVAEGPSQSVPSLVHFANVNDDACTDVVSTAYAFISACNGSTATTFTATYGIIGTIDWNGDGRTDLLETNGTNLYVQLSTGTGFGTAMQISVPYSLGYTYITLDANGDGLDDLGAYGSTGSFTYYLHNGAGQQPDLLTSLTDGYGNTVSPTYAPLVEANYTNNGNATYPYKNWIGPLYVATTVTFSDPTNPPNGTYSETYSYAGAWMNLQGRGFAGFSSFQQYDSRSGIWETWGFDLTFPQTGLLTMDAKSLNNTNTELISEVNNTPATTTLSGQEYAERYFPYVSASTTQRYQVTGNTTGGLVETDSANFSYDDYGNATSIVSTRTDEDGGSPDYGQSWTTTTTNTPDPNTSTGCLNLLTETQVAYTASSGSPVTMTKQLTPDTTNCRYTQVVTQPSSAYQVTESFGYDSFGNVDSDTVTGVNMASRQTQASWGTTGQFPMSVTDPTGATTSFNYNFSFGLVSSVTDPNGLTTSWQYDGFGRKTQETRADGTYTQWMYVDCINWGGCLLGNNTLDVAHYLYNADGSLQTGGTTYFDELQRPIIANQYVRGGSVNRRDMRYDSLGRVIEQSAPCFWTALTTPCPYWTTATYDLLNRPTSVQRPISSTNSNLQTTTYSYSGPTTTITDPQGNTRTTVTDVNGWLREASDAYGYTVTLGYDAAGSHTSTTDSLGHTLWAGSYAYGIQPFLLGFTDADRGSWGYAVDALGERTAWTDAKGQQFSMTYDALSRPLTRSEPDLYTQWTWGSSAPNYGKLVGVCTGTGTNPTNCTSSPGYSETETYDSLARLSQRAITLPSAGTFTYSWQYDATTGLLDSLTYPVSISGYALELQYGYSYGFLQSVTDVSDSPNVTVWTANATAPAGQVTQETLGNGIVTNRDYDAVTQWLGSIESGLNGGSGVKNLAYLYDELGNVIQRQDNNLGLTENIAYDDDYRFSTSQLNGTQNLAVSYDAMGDITSRSDVAGGASWTYDTTHLHAVDQAGSSNYSYGPYDANGNPSAARGNTISWSSYNYPSAILASTGEELTFAYGPNRARWQQFYEDDDGDTETTDYIGGLMEKVSESNGSVTYRHYIYAGAEPVAIYSRTSSGGTLNYLLTDPEGSISAITNSSGQTVVNESFTAFGDRRNPNSWSGSASGSDLTTSEAITRQGYTFQTLLGEDLGFNHMNGRVQDAITGRFLSPDPYVQAPSNAQNYNRYSYVFNNPLTFVDPSGFQGTEECFSQPAGAIWLGDYTYTDSDGTQGIAGFFAPFQLPPICINYPSPWGTSSGGGQEGSGSASGNGNGGNSGSTSPPPPTLPTTLTPPTQTSTQQNPCSSAGNALSPQQYASQGSSLLQQVDSIITTFPGPNALPEAGGVVLANLAGFHRGGPLDAQAAGSSAAYANYVFGAYMAAAGFSLSDTLSGANGYASLFSSYRPGTQMNPSYPSTPAVNVTNITSGFNAYQNGTLCTKP